MLILGVALGLILGLLAGGKIENLVYVRLKWIALLFLAAAIRFGTEFLLVQGNDFAEQFRLPLFATAYALLLSALYVNRRQPGIAMAFVGILGNAIAILGNGGYMPVWQPSLIAAGFEPDQTFSPLHVIVPAPLNAEFLAHFGFLGDIIPIPLPLVQNVASIGDIFLSAGLGFFLFATVVRGPEELRRIDYATPNERLRPAFAGAGAQTLAADGSAFPSSAYTPTYPMETGVTPALAEAAALERPIVLGGSGAGLASPGLSSLPVDLEAAAARARRGVAVPAILERARRHPYVRLALNGSFSALWVGQLISLFGDRMHQIALVFLVLAATNSPLAVGLVFIAAAVPNLVLGPIAGTFVDRWNQKEVMIVSDLLRAAIVLFIPIAAVTNLVLVYPLVFLLTSISIFFRPARTAVLPRIVAEDELLTANSAIWIAETLADVIGYPLAGLFVAFLGTALPVAFWLDAATYLASALLIATMAIPAVSKVRRSATSSADAASRAAESAHADADAGDDAADEGATDASHPGVAGFLDELRTGWSFLRHETVLLANTCQGVVGQFTAGVILTLTSFYAADVLQEGQFDATAAYAFLETGIGLGNLVGGFAIGLLGTRLAKGRLVIFGYSLMGLCVVGLALTNNLGVALGMTFGSGVANMAYVIPSQTLFQERTPADLIGRVVSFRFALVFGAMTIAMAVSGILASAFGVTPVLAFFGLLTIGAGLGGLLVPALRDA